MTEKNSILDPMKSAFHLWKKHFVKIALVGLIFYFPVQVIGVSMQIGKIVALENFQNISLIKAAFELLNVYSAIKFLIGSVALLGIINFSIRILENKEELTIGAIILHGFKKWPLFMGKRIWAGIIIRLYSLLLIIPGIYKSVRFTFIDCVVSTNTNIFVDEIDTSERLVENNWWKVFWFLLLIFLLSSVFDLLFFMVVYLFLESYFLSLSVGAITIVIQTYFIVAKANYYLNIKKIKSENTELNKEQQETNNAAIQ